MGGGYGPEKREKWPEKWRKRPGGLYFVSLCKAGSDFCNVLVKGLAAIGALFAWGLGGPRSRFRAASAANEGPRDG